jgi:hypothetical protein
MTKVLWIKMRSNCLFSKFINMGFYENENKKYYPEKIN